LAAIYESYDLDFSHYEEHFCEIMFVGDAIGSNGKGKYFADIHPDTLMTFREYMRTIDKERLMGGEA